MANNYTEFSELIENLTDEERSWFERRMEKLEADNEEDFIGDFSYGIEDGGKTLWIYSDESGDIDVACDVIQEFLAEFRPSESFTLSWAATCSKPRVGEFGGGAVYVTADRVEYVSSWGWIDQKKNGTDLESIARALVSTGDDEGCDGLVVVDREAFLRLQEAVEGGKL